MQTPWVFRNTCGNKLCAIITTVTSTPNQLSLIVQHTHDWVLWEKHPDVKVIRCVKYYIKSISNNWFLFSLFFSVLLLSGCIQLLLRRPLVSFAIGWKLSVHHLCVYVQSIFEKRYYRADWTLSKKTTSKDSRSLFKHRKKIFSSTSLCLCYTGVTFPNIITPQLHLLFLQFYGLLWVFCHW